MTESYESLHEEEAKDIALVVKERADRKVSVRTINQISWAFISRELAALYARFTGMSRNLSLQITQITQIR